MDTAAAVMEVVMAVMVDMAVSTAAREMAGEEVVRE
jgi:hypothetical protein